MHSLNEKVYGIVATMQSNLPGRGITAKLLADEKVMLILNSFETDARRIPEIENHLKSVFNETVKKIKEQFEDQYGHDITLSLDNEVADNQPLGWSYTTGRAGGAFMGNAGQEVRNVNVRIVRVYSLSSDE